MTQCIRTVSYMPSKISNPLRDKVPSSSDDIAFRTTAIVWRPSPNAPDCIKNQRIENLEDWLDWLNRNYLSSQCNLENKSCQLRVSGIDGVVEKPIAQAIKDCVEVVAPFGVQSNVFGKRETENTLEPQYIPYDLSCDETTQRLDTCFPEGYQGEIPRHIFGMNDNADKTGKTINLFRNTTEGLPVYQIEIPQNDSNNRFSDVFAGQRLIPQNTTVIRMSNAVGGEYDNITTNFTAPRAGWWHIDLAVQNTVFYTPAPNLSRSRGSLLFGIKHVNTANNNKAIEYRMSQVALRYWSGTSQPANAFGSTLLYLNKGDIITPRFWLGGTHPSQIDIQLASGSENRWAIHYQQEQETYAIGE